VREVYTSALAWEAWGVFTFKPDHSRFFPTGRFSFKISGPALTRILEVLKFLKNINQEEIMKRYTAATLIAVLLAFSATALAQAPGAGQGQGQTCPCMMMQGTQMPQMMEQMSQGKLSPEDQKKIADMMQSCPMMKMMEPMSQGKLSPEDQKKMADSMKSCPMMKKMPQQQKPEHPKQ
jgi:ferredoxin